VYYRTTCVVESASFYMLMLSTSVHLSNSKWLSLFSGGLFLVIGQVNRQGSLYSKKKKKNQFGPALVTDSANRACFSKLICHN
jgi:hypothetical protein